MEDSLDLSKSPSKAPLGEPAKVPDLAGRTLGDFQLLRKLGEGGMGHVYLARQLSLKRQVAVKILRPEFAANQSALQRFRREAEAVAGINHANIVQIYSIGESEGMHYMALEYVEGRNLRDYLRKKGPPELHIALNIMRQVASALQRAGEMGFVHRDVKPENILLTRKTEVKIADFGLSRCFATPEPLNLTRSGESWGTPLYMSPEQVQGKVVDPRSDIYSFGVSCYHMLVGEPPFNGASAFDVALKHVQNQPPSLEEQRPDLPPELCSLIQRMMAKNPDDRPQNAKEILRELSRIREALSMGQTAAIPSLSPTNGTSSGRVSDVVRVFEPTPYIGASEASSGERKWWRGGTVLLLALTAGVAARWTTDPSRPEPKLPLTEGTSENSHLARFRAEEAALIASIDNKKETREASVDATIELLMLYLRERKWTEAEEFLNSLAKRAKFQVTKDDSGIKPGRMLISRFYANEIAPLGRAILESYRDQAANSNRLFSNVFTLRDLFPKKEQSQALLDLFFISHPKWRREVADALDRNAKNLNPTTHKLDDPLLEKYRGYVPKLPMFPEKRAEPK